MMAFPFTLIVVELITVHMIDGRVVEINPKQITQLMSTRPGGAPNKALVEGVRCLIHFTDGSKLSTAEDCNTIRRLMEE